ncbi:MAG TPA: hypothetical protein VGH80_08840 [Xanthomonadaceae bacterium]
MPEIVTENTKPKGLSLMLQRIAGIAILAGLAAMVCGFNWRRMAEAACAAILLALGRLAWMVVQRQRRRHLLAHDPNKVALHPTRLLR